MEGTENSPEVYLRLDGHVGLAEDVQAVVNHVIILGYNTLNQFKI
jgi:hypothetical protein